MTEPRWKQRYRAPNLTLPDWGIDAPERLAYATNASGSWQIHAWDREGGAHRQVTEHPTGVVDGDVTPDGSGILWFEDSKGDEIGRWLLQPFAGGEITPLLPDAEPAWSAGLALGPKSRVAVGLADRDGFTVRVGVIGEGSDELYRHEQTVDVMELSRDGRLLVVQHAEHGDNLHPALRVFDLDGGNDPVDLWDGAGLSLFAAGFSPVPGDSRLALLHERTGQVRPAIWDPVSGKRIDLDVNLPGEVVVADWWPDGRALLLVHTHLGRDELVRLDLTGGGLHRLDHPAGSIGGASVRPDGTVWYRWSSGSAAPEVRAVAAKAAVLRPPGPAAPGGTAYQSWTFTNPSGRQVHGFLITPEGKSSPFPTAILIHGGPTSHDADAWSPQVQALVDHGWAVALVNYRGSTGYGKAWQDALEGDPGFPEVEDVTAGRDDLVARGVADPDRILITGASWGGYITLLAIGTRPQGWRAAAAVVPVADYLSAYADESEGLQAFDRSLFGGSPDDKPDLYRSRSPITYADQVETPVLLMVGDNDTRCPLQQVLNYTDSLRSFNRPFELDRFDAGHGALVTDERIRQTEVILDFAARHVPGVEPPEQ